MTILEKKSLRKKKAILNLVDKGEYSPAYALILVEELSDAGKLTDTDYEELAEYLEELLNEENRPAEVVEEHVEAPMEETEQLDTEVNSNEQNDTETVEEPTEEVADTNVGDIEETVEENTENTEEEAE